MIRIIFDALVLIFFWWIIGKIIKFFSPNPKTATFNWDESVPATGQRPEHAAKASPISELYGNPLIEAENKSGAEPEQEPIQEDDRYYKFSNSQIFRSNNILFMGHYYPVRDPEHDEYSELILSLKDEDLSTIRRFVQLFDTEKFARFLRDKVLCIVPSSKAGHTTTGMSRLVRDLAAKFGGYDGTSLLYRKTTIQSAHSGGKRDKSLHLETIGVRNRHLIQGSFVVVFDDVFTTGSSVEACMLLLKNNGASKTCGIILGKTRRSNQYYGVF